MSYRIKINSKGLTAQAKRFKWDCAAACEGIQNARRFFGKRLAHERA
jgi:hypothetical protein